MQRRSVSGHGERVGATPPGGGGVGWGGGGFAATPRDPPPHALRRAPRRGSPSGAPGTPDVVQEDRACPTIAPSRITDSRCADHVRISGVMEVQAGTFCVAGGVWDREGGQNHDGISNFFRAISLI